MSQVHDDDTDYSDLDEETSPAAPASHGPRGPKNRERLSERTPLLSTSPPPPAYADVTRLYGTPPYLARNDPNGIQRDQTRHDDAVEPAHPRPEEPQSMGDPGRDAEDGSKLKRKRRFNIKKVLACLVFILAISLVGLMAITTTKHDKSSDDQVSSLPISSHSLH
jgi:hypothetical protein